METNPDEINHYRNRRGINGQVKSMKSKNNFSFLIKPCGPACNLNCEYCFYQEKKQLFSQKGHYKLPSQVLETFIKQYIESQEAPEVHFTWQGGEPTLLGIEFYKNAVNLQSKYCDGKTIINAIQTNGVLIDDRWGEFFSENQFLVGISIDGPQKIHDRYRRGPKGQPTFEAVMKGLETLKKHQTSFNTMTVVNDVSAHHALGLYRFLKSIGDGFMQFIPLVERRPDESARRLNLNFGLPPNQNKSAGSASVMPWSVKPKHFAEFYIQIFDEWIRHDVGKQNIQFFEVALGNWLGVGAELCHFSPTCGNTGVLEYNGDVYTCDHYVYPDYRLGNILETNLSEIMRSSKMCEFGAVKREFLPFRCQQCNVLFACNGDCPKHRFVRSVGKGPRHSYLCSAYKKIFTYMDGYMNIMPGLIRTGRDASTVMKIVARDDKEMIFKQTKRNSPCPCGSGKKYKRCCGMRDDRKKGRG